MAENTNASSSAVSSANQMFVNANVVRPIVRATVSPNTGVAEAMTASVTAEITTPMNTR